VTGRPSSGQTLKFQANPALVLNWIALRSDLQIALAFYLCAFAVRLFVACFHGISTPLSSDEPEYYEPAMRLVQGQGYSHLWPDGVLRLSAYRVPGASAIIAMGLLVFGKHVESARLTAVLVGSCAAPLMYLFARKVAPRGESLASGIACLFYPTWVFFSGAVWSEPYFIPLLLLSLLLTTRAVYSSLLWNSLIAGVAWGATGLIRPQGAAMALILTLYLFSRVGLQRAALFLFGFTLLVAPWVTRNLIVFGHPFLATEAGETFLGSNNPHVVRNPALHGMWVAPREIPEYWEAIESNYNEAERSQIQSQIAWQYLKGNPRVIPTLALYKLERWLTPITVTGGLVRFTVLASYGTLLLFLAVGCFRRVYRASVELHFALIWTLLSTVLTIVYWGNLTRGRLPVEIVWIPWGAMAAFNIFSLRRRALKPIAKSVVPEVNPSSA
jgi:4-amino-4-deoxy-L-arabinose transferase-like glycosyltransferase